MYYEEGLIDGVLMYRTDPNGSWRTLSIEKITQRILESEEEIKKSYERGYLDGKNYEKDRIRTLLKI